MYVFHAEGETDIDTELYPFGEFCYEVTPGGRLERDPEFVCVVDEYTVTADDADEALGKASIMRLTPGTEPASRVDVVPG